jgi:hypothetical protein
MKTTNRSFIYINFNKIWCGLLQQELMLCYLLPVELVLYAFKTLQKKELYSKISNNL